MHISSNSHIVFDFFLLCFDRIEKKNVWFLVRILDINETKSSPFPETEIAFYTPPHNSGGVLWFHVGRLWVRPSVVRHPSVFRFRMITWVNINGFSPNLVCALILWRSDLGLLMGKFRQFLTELSARDTPIFSFPDDNLSKHQWIFTKLGICIDNVEIWFGIANGQISSIFDGVICLSHAHIFVSGW